MNVVFKKVIIGVVVIVAIVSFTGLWTYLECPSPEDATLVLVASKITINGVPLQDTLYYCIKVEGGSNPYPWDLWRPNGHIFYYFVEDLGKIRADNYRDTIVGISLIYPVAEEHRNYNVVSNVPEDYVKTTTFLDINETVPLTLCACIFSVEEGGAKRVMCGNTLISNYDGKVPPGFQYDIKYIPLATLGISDPKW